jgi:hypothetical protein
MFGSNPNSPNNPFAPKQSWMSKQTNGSSNPYGFGYEQLAGKLALQRNVPGMPTNTVPLPGRHGGSGGATPTQFGSVQEMIDRGYTWQQIYSMAQQGNNGVSLGDYTTARTTSSPNTLTNPNQPGGTSVLPSGNRGWQQPHERSAFPARPRATLGSY